MFLCGFAGVLAGNALTASLGGGFYLDTTHPAQIVLAAIAIVLAAYLIFRRLGNSFVRSLINESGVNNLLPAFAPTGRQSGLAEEEDIARLVSELRAGPSAAPVPAVLVSLGESARKPADSADALKEFFQWTRENVPAMKALAEKWSRPGNPASHRETLVEIRERISLLKHRAGLPQLRPVWQLATALEGLLKQLTDRVSNITHSTLRTVDGAIELLGELCQPGIRPDLAANPAIRILAVDDDSVSRFALGASLKKVFEDPQLADSGESALSLSKLNRYDLIVLDVMLSGMDGFEVCSLIRNGAVNGSTPVLFVTALKDFDTRAKSMNVAGTDLMGKPFLTFEIAVKALTMTLCSRLRDRNRVRESSGEAAAGHAPAVGWPPVSASATGETKYFAKSTPDTTTVAAKKSTAPVTTGTLPPAVYATAAPNGEAGKTAAENPAAAPREISVSFQAYVVEKTGELKDQISLIDRTEPGQIRNAMLSQLQIRFQCLTRKVNVPELRPAAALGASLDGLFGKFAASSRIATSSALRTASAGLDLFVELCQSRPKTDLADNPPMRMLVVDDEPLARRAITGALQMAFARPDSVESGEAAVALAAEKEFDVVFMDVFMPGMDGFTACTGIHDVAFNRATPVVFVTSHSDDQFRAESARCGGSDFVIKPFAFAEISVKALTFALRGRLQKLNSPPAAAKLSPAATTEPDPIH